MKKKSSEPVEPQVQHTCTICGKTEAWGPTWAWYGSDLLAEMDTGAIAKVCSEDCREKYKPSEEMVKACKSAAKKAKRESYVDEEGRWG